MVGLSSKLESLDLEDQNDTHIDHINTQVLDKHAQNIKTDELSGGKTKKTTKDKANRATVENVLDPRTMRFLQALTSRGVISEFNGCLSTGKEANVYHAYSGTGSNGDKERSELAIKIFKTSILVFKDRERYVDGEFRFRNSRSQHNPRKMIKVWAEKEFRNLKRIHQSNVVPAPKPVEVKSNVLIMEFLNRGDGFASPRLKDYPFKDAADVAYYYHTMISYMRLLYQNCRLVHADLSEYNALVHQKRLYIIDVSQSVQPEHPMSLDFLRMDIKNVNGFFERFSIDIFSERIIFQFVISEMLEKFMGDYNSSEDLVEYMAKNLPIKTTPEDEAEDEVFRSLHLVRNLGGLEERDFDRFTMGKFDLLKSLIANDNKKNAKNFTASEQFDLSSSSEDENEDDFEEDENDGDSDNGESDSEEDTEDESDGDYVEKSKELKHKKHEDKDVKKQRKDDAKDAKREKRKTKVKKHIKKRLVKKTKSKK